MRSRFALLALLAVASGLGALPACETKTSEAPATVRAGEAEHIVVQHVLIAFDRAERSKSTRKRDEAETLAKEILERARKGEDFDALVKEHTDDAYPGIYGMANDGVRADTGADELPRRRMATSFGDVSFALSPGGVEMAPYHMQDSPYGWHVIKRLK